MPNSDFLTQPSLPRPEVGPDDAAAVAEQVFGLSGRIAELGSNQDRNFLIDTGTERFVLKVANPAFSLDELHAQNAALERLAGIDVRIPTVVPALDGAEVVAVEVRGRTLNARVLSFLDGDPLTEVARPSREQLRTLGRLSGRIAAGHQRDDRGRRGRGCRLRSLRQNLDAQVVDVTEGEDLLDELT